MGNKNVSGVRKVTRGGKPRLIIDFPYTDKAGTRRRFRRDATVQLHSAALAEAKRLMARAAATGSVQEEEEEQERVAAKAPLLFKEFVEGDFNRLFMPEYREGTRIRYRALLNNQGVLAAFGDQRLDEIGAQEYRAFAAQLRARGVQVKGPLNMVRTVLRAAVECGVLDEFPKLPSLIKASRKMPDAPSEAELAAMCEAAEGWLKIAIFLAVLAGLRQGEVRGLEVRDVDLEGQRLFVRRALSENSEVTPKSGHDRVVPLTPELLAVLKEAMKSKLPRARIVVTEQGATLTRQGFLYQFKQFLKKHGLRERSFHSLRHGFCTTLIRRGASLEAVRELLGHSGLHVTQRYAHAVAEDLQRAIATLSPAGR